MQLWTTINLRTSMRTMMIKLTQRNSTMRLDFMLKSEWTLMQHIIHSQAKKKTRWLMLNQRLIRQWTTWTKMATALSGEEKDAMADAEPAIDKAMDNVDEDGDGALSKKEFEAEKDGGSDMGEEMQEAAKQDEDMP